MRTAGDEGASQVQRCGKRALGPCKYLKEGTARPMRLEWNEQGENDRR